MRQQYSLRLLRFFTESSKNLAFYFQMHRLFSAKHLAGASHGPIYKFRDTSSVINYMF